MRDPDDYESLQYEAAYNNMSAAQYAEMQASIRTMHGGYFTVTAAAPRSIPRLPLFQPQQTAPQTPARSATVWSHHDFPALP